MRWAKLYSANGTNETNETNKNKGSFSQSFALCPIDLNEANDANEHNDSNEPNYKSIWETTSPFT